MPNSGQIAGAVTAVAAVFVLHRLLGTSRTKPRQNRIRPSKERVLILGASSGLGRTLAKQYAARGARVCVVARRKEALEELATECDGDGCLPFAADFTQPEAMIRLRDELLRRWDGLDTLHVCAGVSAVQPVMALTGIEFECSHEDPTTDGIRRAAGYAEKAAQGNFFGPLVAVVTFLSTMKRTSEAPAILLVSSVAAVVPAPTRALYAATKAASLLFFQSLSIEHPDVAFTAILPATIEGNFRASAVDADADPRQNKTADETNKRGLKMDYVANRCADAVDRGLRGNVVIPWFPYAIAHHLYYLWPSVIEAQARRKYKFTA
ncbi:short chain dehydrogenase [Xylaria sp. CBS 124048]|nr:short chain dehydrogenase [Xylaria sp. CBS 124048]